MVARDGGVVIGNNTKRVVEAEWFASDDTLKDDAD